MVTASDIDTFVFVFVGWFALGGLVLAAIHYLLRGETNIEPLIGLCEINKYLLLILILNVSVFTNTDRTQLQRQKKTFHAAVMSDRSASRGRNPLETPRLRIRHRGRLSRFMRPFANLAVALHVHIRSRRKRSVPGAKVRFRHGRPRHRRRPPKTDRRYG